MRFLRIRAARFGPLLDLDTGDGDDLGDLVALLGPNEAGKSAFHRGVVSLLYGFYPATRDAHPLAPWDGGNPELDGWLRTADGEELHVRRRLLSRPDGTVERGEAVEQIRNRALAGIAHVSMPVYEQVYALTLGDLARLEDEGWGAVQDRLVVGMGSSDLRSPREAIEALETAAQGLWRTDQRGKPRHAELKKELEALREARREAVERDRALRERDRRVAELESEAEELRAEQERIEAERDRVSRLRPLAGRLRQLARHESDAGDPAELEGLPSDPGQALEAFAERIEDCRSRRRRVAAALETAEERAAQPRPGDRALVEREAELRALADRAPVLQERAANRGRLEAELADLDRRIDAAAGPLFDGEAPPPDALSSLDLPRLRSALEALRRADDDLGGARVARERLGRDDDALPPPRPDTPSLVVLGAGLLLIAAGLLVGSGAEWPSAPALLLLIVGGLAAAWGGRGVSRWSARREFAAERRAARAREREELDRRVEEAETRVRDRQAAVDELLGSLPLRASVREDLRPELAGDLVRVRDLALDRAGRAGVVSAMREEDEATGRALGRARDELEGLRDLPADPVAALPELGRRLDEARRSLESAAAAAEERDRLQGELEEIDRDLAGLEERRDELRAQVRAAGGETARADGDGETSLEQALAVVRSRLRAGEARRGLLEELRRDRPDLEAERREIREAREAGERWLDDPEAQGRLDRELREVGRRLAEVAGELGRARTEMRTLEAGETVDLVDGRIRAVDEELKRVARERDRRFVLARLIATAERRFRDAHQPDLLRRASRHLARITDGRYARLLLDAEPGGEPFLLDAEHLPHPHPIGEPLSTGTREQTYLALRLAIVDHLDRDREPLPLFLDEVLVNWDRDRRDRGLDLLADVAQRRQVFLFTCHPDLAGAVEARGGRVIELAAPRAVG